MIISKSYVRFGRCQIRFRSRVGRCKASGWTRKVQSIFSHFVRRNTSHLSKAISSFFRQYDYRILDNKTIIFFTKSYLFNKISSTLGSSRKHDDHGALPPLPKIMPKHDEDMGGIGKKYRRTAGVSAHLFDAMANYNTQ